MPHLKRLRLSSIEINEIDDEFIQMMKENNILADHLHLPLQSGSDAVLKMMERRYDLAFFKEKIRKIRAVRPEISITTDVIVGFPYETSEEFAATKEFIKEIKFSKLHVFPYSKREGTKAAAMPQIQESIKKERTSELLALSRELEEQYAKQFIGTIQDVIIEQVTKDGLMVGHSSNYLEIRVPADNQYLKQDVKVRILDYKNDKMIGEII